MGASSRWPVRLCASFTEAQRERLEQAAQEKATSISSIIRRAVEEYLATDDAEKNDA